MVLCDPSGYSESASCSSEASHGSGRRNQELRGRPASSGENNASAVTHKGASHFPGAQYNQVERILEVPHRAPEPSERTEAL